jgi:ssDNA thymidine ADP-ribosyltransferase, DarT
VDRADLAELHYISPVANVLSLCRHGILAHNLVNKVTGGNHVSVAAQEVQDRRASKRVPNGMMLHDYANLYLCARNPMLFKRLKEGYALCVVIVSTQALDLDGVVVSDGNAASDWTAFREGAAGLEIVDKGLTFARYWTDPDYYEELRKRRAKCAEVLVPGRVPAKYLKGIRVMSDAAGRGLANLGVSQEVIVDADLFFR